MGSMLYSEYDPASREAHPPAAAMCAWFNGFVSSVAQLAPIMTEPHTNAIGMTIRKPTTPGAFGGRT